MCATRLGMPRVELRYAMHTHPPVRLRGTINDAKSSHRPVAGSNCLRPGDGMTSRRLWCRASRAQADACAWRTAIPPSACPAGSRTCARCAPANRAQACWRTSMARRPAGARLRRSPPAVRWSAPGRSRTFWTGPRGRWRVSWCGGVPAPRSHARAAGGRRRARACDGAVALEGYPQALAASASNQASGYAGTVPLFEAHGFSRVCQTTGRGGGKPRWLVRRDLS